MFTDSHTHLYLEDFENDIDAVIQNALDVNINRFLLPNIDNNTIIVGAHLEDSNQTTITNGTTSSADNSKIDSGAVYVYKISDADSFTQEAYIKAANADQNDKFGASGPYHDMCCLEIHKNTLVVGTHLEDSNQTMISNGYVASNNNDVEDSNGFQV